MENSNPKIYVFDVGNTLIKKPNTKIDSKLVDDLLHLKEAGNVIGVATMRNPVMLTEVFTQVHFDFCITLNGAYVECHNHMLMDSPIADSELMQLIKAIELLNIDYALYSKYEVHKSFQLEKSYYGVELTNCGDKAILLQNRFPSFAFHIWERGKSCDLHSKNVSKSKGMIEVCDYLKIPLKNTIAFGDGFNDIDLFKVCNVTVAMGSAPEELKQIASFITKEAGENGVSYALNNMLL